MKELADPDGRDDTALLALTTIPLTDDRISLRIPATPGSLAQGRRMLARWLEGRGAEPEEIRDIELACHEACTNAAEHGHSFAEAHFDLEAVHREGEVALTVRDTGSWREPMNGNRGKGLVLMRQLMDDVSVETTPDGTVVELRRLLS
jgi:anti-sigma regulatory factor (Ser/Thr protein kinase)